MLSPADAVEIVLVALEDVGSAGAGAGCDTDEDGEADGGIVADRCGADESLSEADLEGPRSAATCAERVTKDLYWYFASWMSAIRKQG